MGESHGTGTGPAGFGGGGGAAALGGTVPAGFAGSFGAAEEGVCETGDAAGLELSAGEPGAAFPLVSSDIVNAVSLVTADSRKSNLTFYILLLQVSTEHWHLER